MGAELIDKLDAELNALKEVQVRLENVGCLTDVIEKQQAEIASLRAQLESLNYELSGRKLEIITIKQQLSESNARAADLHARCNSFEGLLELVRAELKAELERNRWIPVGERLPEEENDYLVADKWGYVFEADYEKALSGFVYINPAGDRLADKTVTHWREMPAPPEAK